MVRRSKLTWSRSAPLSRRTIWCSSSSLVVVWLDILRSWWCTICLSCATLTTAKEIQTRLDVCIRGIKLCCTFVCIKSIAGLIVAGLILFRSVSLGSILPKITSAYQGTKIIPNLGDVGIQAYSPRVCIKGIPVLIDLVVKHTNGTPKGRVTSVTVDGLLICFICLGEFVLRHVATTEQIPALCVSLV